MMAIRLCTMAFFLIMMSVRSFSVVVHVLRQPLQQESTMTPVQTKLKRHLVVTSMTKKDTYNNGEDDIWNGEDSAVFVSDSGTATIASRPSQQQQLGSPICMYDQMIVPVKLVSKLHNGTNNALCTKDMNDEIIPQQEMIVYDITKQIQQFISERCGTIQCGTITLFNRHTTTSLIINEYESRLLRDMQTAFLQFIPPDVRSYAYQKAQQMGTPFPDPVRQYEHNDIHLRPESWEETTRCYENGYNISDPVILQSWRDSEPINAHSHLLSMMIGSPTLTIPIQNSTMQIGTWQSIMLIDFDGPRLGRTVGIQITGYQ